MNLEIHRNMFGVVEQWVQNLPDRGRSLNDILSAQSVRAGRNHKAEHMPEGGIPNPFGGPGAVLGGRREMDADTSRDNQGQGYSTGNSSQQDRPAQPYGNENNETYVPQYNAAPPQQSYGQSANYGPDHPGYSQYPGQSGSPGQQGWYGRREDY